MCVCVCACVCVWWEDQRLQCSACILHAWYLLFFVFLGGLKTLEGDTHTHTLVQSSLWTDLAYVITVFPTQRSTT